MKMSSYMLPQYSTVLFRDVWGSVNDFLEDYENDALYLTCGLSTAQLSTIAVLLASQYGNNPIANRDVNQFKFQIYSTIYQYGPNWVKRMEVQKALRELTDAELLQGAEAVYNHAFNPETAPGTGDRDDKLTYINEQNVTMHTKGILDGYAILLALLEDDITYKFLKKFQHCFKQFVAPEDPLLFVTEEDED